MKTTANKEVLRNTDYDHTFDYLWDMSSDEKFERIFGRYEDLHDENEAK